MTGDLERGAEGKVILCAANSYEEKYYLNPVFKGLPESIQKELQIICVLFTEDIGGRSDIMPQKQRMELLQSLELYYKTVILGLPLEEA